jgi:ATP-binding cassette, subfamily F, member 3
MVSGSDISLTLGGKELFRSVSFRIGPHDRIGLVGSNGAGKSTLLRMLLGEITPDSGELAKARYVTVGYLPQDGVVNTGATLYATAESVFADIVGARERLEEIGRRMETLDHGTEEFQELLELYGELQHHLEDADAFRMESTIEKVLFGLGFTARDLQRPTGEFSGGWQMRIALARLLLQQPSLLLLDEPTNHLDLDSLQWLEEYLASYRGAVMLVSHDRRFLDTMTRKTYDLSLGSLVEYAGNFTFAVAEREKRRELQLAAYRNQQQQIKQTERFIERFRYKATKARQVQSRIKQLEKLDLIELEDEEGGIHFSFPPAPPGGRSVMELRGIVKRYGTQTVFEGLDFDIDRGDRIAFVGVNGAGKSTLARIITGTEPIESGERKVGHNVILSYFAQDQAEELNPSLDVLQTVDAVATGDVRKRLRTLLGCFLFHGDDVFKKVGVLSGGEKSRLALAKMLLEPANLLILDEPTNHLDMRSKGVLQEALLGFDGSMVIVSHDRDFLDPVVTRVVEFSAGRVRSYTGNITEYLEARQRDRENIQAAAVAAAVPAKSEKERKRAEAELRQRRYAKTRPVQEAIAKVEAAIGRLEGRKGEVEKLMADPELYRDGERAKEISTEYRQIGQELQDAYFRWNDLTQELERLNTEIR